MISDPVPRDDDIHIRTISRDDWKRLQQFHARLSPTTVSLRFHAAKRELTEPLAHRFTEMDGRDEVALVAVEGTGERIVGVARYSRLDLASAEVAFVVEDKYQRHHIGSLLMARLKAAALRNGITKFVAEVIPGNTPMLRLLAEAGPTRCHSARDEYEVTVDLTSAFPTPWSVH